MYIRYNATFVRTLLFEGYLCIRHSLLTPLWDDFSTVEEILCHDSYDHVFDRRIYLGWVTYNITRQIDFRFYCISVYMILTILKLEGTYY